MQSEGEAELKIFASNPSAWEAIYGEPDVDAEGVWHPQTEDDLEEMFAMWEHEGWLASK